MSPRALRLASVLCLLLCCAVGDAQGAGRRKMRDANVEPAQGRSDQEHKSRVDPPGASNNARGETPQYEAQMLRLGELMGALSFLRDLCGSGDGAHYREKASALIEAEASPARERIAGAFNRGYRGYEATYARCTPNARAIIDKYKTEGGNLAREIAARYSGS